VCSVPESSSDLHVPPAATN